MGFAMHLHSLLRNEHVQDALGIDEDIAELLHDLACECFIATTDSLGQRMFYSRIHHMGL